MKILLKPFTALAGKIDHTVEQKILMSVARHCVTIGAGALAAHGIISGSAIADFVAATMALIAIVSGGAQKVEQPL